MDLMREEVPRYDELQERTIDAIPFAPDRVLELGFGTAETTQRLLDRYPQTRITGLDSSSEMVFKARELGWEEMRLGRIEDPLPDGPWDLVVAVLTIHHLDADGKRDLFRRVREQSRSLVDRRRRRGARGSTRDPDRTGLRPAVAGGRAGRVVRRRGRLGGRRPGRDPGGLRLSAWQRAQPTSAGSSSRPARRSRPRCTAARNFSRLTSSVERISSA